MSTSKNDTESYSCIDAVRHQLTLSTEAPTMEALGEVLEQQRDRGPFALLLAHPSRYMTADFENLISSDSWSCADVYFIGAGSSKQNLELRPPTALDIDSRQLGRFRTIQRLANHYRSLVVFSAGDLETALAVDSFFGTNFALESPSVSTVPGLTTRHEEYTLVPGAGLALDRQLGDQKQVIMLAEYQDMEVLWIGDSAFERSQIELIHIPRSVRSVGVRAFFNCSALSTVTFSPSTLNLMTESFAGTALQHVKVPKSVHTIGPRAFADCKELESVELPSSLETIADDAFESCSPNLLFNVIEGSVAHAWAERLGYLCTVKQRSTFRTPKPLQYKGLLYRELGPSSLELVGVSSRSAGLEELTVPPIVKRRPVIGIGPRALRGMTALRSLKLHPGIRWIGRRAFSDSKSLTPSGISGATGLISVASNALPGHDLTSIIGTTDPQDDRTVRLTPRMLFAQMGQEPPRDFPRKVLDVDLTRVVHIPAQVSKGSAFFYWHDENDFHDEPSPLTHVSEAVNRGAAVMIAAEHVTLPDGVELPTIICPHPRDLFREVNAMLRRQYDPKTIAITGSIGKTTTKQMLELVVQQSFNAKVSEGNNNNVNFTGRVFSTLERSHEVYVQETGASYFGQVEALSHIVKPDAFLVANIGTNHLTGYGESQQELLKDKLSADKILPDDGVAFLNYDDPLLRDAQITHEIISFGIDNPNARFRALNVTEGPNRVAFTVIDQNTGETTPVTLNVVGYHNAYSALSAFAVGRWLGISPENISEALTRFQPQFMRQAVMTFDGQQVLVDCYNASEASVVSSAQSLQHLIAGDGGRRVYIFGDLTNRGSVSEDLHRQIGKELAQEAGLDLLVCYGEDSRFTAEAARELGLETFHTASLQELCDYLGENTSKADVLGLKGSRRMRLEQVVDVLFGTTLAIAPNMRRYIAKMEHISSKGVGYRVIPARGLGVFKLEDDSNLELEIPSEVENQPVDVLLHESFLDSPLEVVKISAPLRAIGRDAFRRSRQLRHVELPETLRVIDHSAFSACSSLKELNVPEGVRTLGDRAFRYCRTLERLTLPDSLHSIGADFIMGSEQVTVICNEGSFADEFLRQNWPSVQIERPQ